MSRLHTINMESRSVWCLVDWTLGTSEFSCRSLRRKDTNTQFVTAVFCQHQWKWQMSFDTFFQSITGNDQLLPFFFDKMIHRLIPVHGHTAGYSRLLSTLKVNRIHHRPVTPHGHTAWSRRICSLLVAGTKKEVTVKESMSRKLSRKISVQIKIIRSRFPTITGIFIVPFLLYFNYIYVSPWFVWIFSIWFNEALCYCSETCDRNKKDCFCHYHQSYLHMLVELHEKTRTNNKTAREKAQE